MNKIYGIVLILFLSTATFAQKGEMKLVPTSNPDIYKLYYVADIESNIKLNIKGENGSSVFKREVKNKKGFILPIDFSEYKTGKYNLEIFTPMFTLTDTINYISIEDRLKSKFECEVVPDRVRVIITALEPLEGDLTVFISDNNGKQVDKQVINGLKFGMRVFDFADNPAKSLEVNLYYKNNLVNTCELKKN